VVKKTYFIIYFSHVNSTSLFLLCLFFQDWFAFIGNGSEFNATLEGEALFPNFKAPTAEDNYGFCQVTFLTVVKALPLTSIFKVELEF